LVPGGNERPRRDGRGIKSGEGNGRASIAAVHQPPAGPPGGANQTPHIAAAVIGASADDDAGATPAPAMMMPAAIVPTTPGRGGGRRSAAAPSEAAAMATSESLRNMIVSSRLGAVRRLSEIISRDAPPRAFRRSVRRGVRSLESYAFKTECGRDGRFREGSPS
jgi:hypothetical protein